MPPESSPPAHVEDALLDEYATGGLGRRQRSAIERHLRACAPCRERLDATRALLSAIEDWLAVPASPVAHALVRAASTLVSMLGGPPRLRPGFSRNVKIS